MTKSNYNYTITNNKGETIAGNWVSNNAGGGDGCNRLTEKTKTEQVGFSVFGRFSGYF